MKYYLVLLVLLFTSFADAAYVASRGFPGEIFMWGGTACPAHSAAADGTSLLRAGTYANLFAAISTANGTVDGTHFNLPDLRGKFPRGVDGSASNDPDHGSRAACNTGGAVNNNVGSCQSFDLQSHTHTWYTTFGTGAQVGSYGATAGAQTPTGGYIGATGGNETRPINVYVLYCIWY